MKSSLLLVCSLLLCTRAYAGSSVAVRLGPGAPGFGGTNPLSIPPGPIDIEVAYTTDSDWDFSASVVPGILAGKKFRGPYGLYAGAGGGFVISINGAALGVYTNAGASFGGGPFYLNVDFKQTLGYSASGIISPYALRVGAIWEFK